MEPRDGKHEEIIMNDHCAPYPRKSLYLVLTIPMIAIYLAIAIFFWQAHRFLCVIYLALFVIAAVSQSVVCVYWKCPYVGEFAPCIGGFYLPSSQIAGLFKQARISERLYNVAASVSFAALFSIIALPVYVLYRQSVWVMLAYLGIIGIYAAFFLWWICPVCGTRNVCPAGQTSTRLRNSCARKSCIR